MKTFIRSHMDPYGYHVNNFSVSLSDRKIKVDITYDGYGWIAVEENYDGEEDKLRIAKSRISEDDALNQLIEKMEEAIANGKNLKY